MAEYSRIAKGHFTSTGLAQVINLPFIPDTIEMTNLTATATPANHGVAKAWWDVSMSNLATPSQGLALINNATPVLTSGTVPLNGFSTFQAGQLLQFGPVYGHNSVATADFSITAASPAVVTTTTAHGLATGNVVIFSNLFQTATTGMNQMASVPMTVTVISSTSFSVNWNASGSNYTAFNSATSTGNIGTWKQVLYPYLYCPGQTVITGVNRTVNEQFTGAANTIQTASAHNFSIGQEVAFRMPSVWGANQLNSLPDILIPGSPIYWYVIAVTQNTFTVSQNSNGLNTLAGLTAFNPNQPFTTVPGLRMPQVIPAGDVNTGGQQIYAGSPLYPSPLLYNGNGTSQVPSINGPAINGSFVNNTSMGFIIGNGGVKVGAAAVDTSSSLVGANGDIIFWRAILSDYAVN